MHVGHIHTNQDWGGGEYQVLNLVKGLIAQEVRSTLFCAWRGALHARAVAASVPVRSLSGPAALLPPVGALFVARTARGCGVNLLHVHDSRAASAGILAARMLNVPLVLSRRIASPLRDNAYSRWKHSVRNVPAIIAISETVRGSLAASGYPSDRIHVVQSGLNLEQLASVETDSDFRKQYGNSKLVGGIGKLSVKKNWQFTVRVAARLARTGPDIRWLLAGDGPERANLETLARELGVSDRVHFLGFRSDATRILKTLDLLFFPSVREGASVVVREAMALGTPVVAVRASGTMESLAGHCWAVEPGDAEGAAKAVVEALTDGAKRRAVCEAAKRSALDRFSMDRTVEGTIVVYRKLVSE